jgi:outer membrane autotransporter protein
MDFKKVLLAGTAIVAVSSFVGQARAASLVMTANDVWADGGAGVLGPAAADDNVDIDGFDLSIVNDQTADDGSGLDEFVLGDITDSDDSGNLIILQSAGGTAAPLDVMIESADVGGDFTVDNADAADQDVTVIVDDALRVGGDLIITNNDTDNNNEVRFGVADGITVDGVTRVFSGDGRTVMEIGDDSTFTGGIEVDESGGDNVFLLFHDIEAQTINGDITSANGGEGLVQLSSDVPEGVTFTGQFGTLAKKINHILLDTLNDDIKATFQDNVYLTNGFTLGNGAGTATLVFDSTNNDFDVVGTVESDGVATANVTVMGGGIVTMNGAWGGGTALDTVIIGANTTLSAESSITAADIAFTGTGGILTSAGANTFTADINGNGTLDIDENTTVVGNIGDATALNRITVLNGKTLIVDADTLGADAEVNATNGILLQDTDVTDNGNGGTLSLDASGQIITVGSDISTALDSEGSILVSGDAGTVSFTGDLGTSTAALQDLTFAAGVAGISTVTTAGNLYVDTVSLSTSDVLQFLGDGVTQTVSSTINASGANLGILTIGDGTTDTDVVFNGQIGATNDLNNLNIATGAQATFAFAGNNGFDGALDLDGTVQINAGSTLDVAGAYDSTADADAGTWNIGVKRTAGTDSSGKFVSGGAIDVSADTANIVIGAGSQPLVAGVINDVITGASVTAFNTVTDTSFLYNFTLTDIGGDNDLDLTVVADNSITDAASNEANAAAGEILLFDLASSTDPAVNQIQANIQAASSAAEINEILEATQPSVDGGAFAGSVNVMTNTMGMTSTRLAALRTGSESGMAAGNIAQGMQMWAQGFGQSAKQDRRDGIDGYDADTAGVAVGIDTENLGDGATAGIALSYGNTQVESHNANRTDTDVDSYQVTLYGSYDLDADTYVNGMAAYGRGKAETVRHNVGGVAGLTAHGEYDSDQYTIRAETGRDYAYRGTILTPHVMGHWTHFSPDGYTETGAGGANLTVDMESMDIAELGVGLDASWTLKQSNGAILEPKVGAGYRYDFVGDNVQATSSFTGGGGTFASQGPDPAQGTFDVGAEISYHTTDNWQFTLNYDFELKQDFDAHSGYLRAGYKF